MVECITRPTIDYLSQPNKSPIKPYPSHRFSSGLDFKMYVFQMRCFASVVVIYKMAGASQSIAQN